MSARFSLFTRFGRSAVLSTIPILLVTACGDEPEPAPAPLRPLRAHEVGVAGAGATRTFSGTAETSSIVNLSFRTQGVITALDMRVGQAVRRGQLLARLDNVAARLGYEQAVTRLNSAASEMNTAELNLNRVRTLYEAGSASLSEYENARNSYTTAVAGHRSAERSVEIEEDRVSFGFIYAPADGVVSVVQAEVNENVSVGETVAVLNAGNTMEITLGLPESVINRVSEGMGVEVELPAVAGSTFEGRLTEVSPSVDPNSATYPVRVTMVDPSEAVRSGMAANVTFDFGEDQTGSGIVVVPAGAVGEDSGGHYVFVVEPATDGSATVRRQAIEIGRLTAEGFEVLGGLTAGQTIAAAGLQTLLEGQRVVPPEGTDG